MTRRSSGVPAASVPDETVPKRRGRGRAGAPLTTVGQAHQAARTPASVSFPLRFLMIHLHRGCRTKHPPLWDQMHTWCKCSPPIARFKMSEARCARRPTLTQGLHSMRVWLHTKHGLPTLRKSARVRSSIIALWVFGFARATEAEAIGPGIIRGSRIPRICRRPWMCVSVCRRQITRRSSGMTGRYFTP